MSDQQAQNSKRIQLIDVLRGLALLAMTLYHFVWDLEYFGWALPATILEPGWVTFARGIASSFLFLTGVSLVFAHGNSINWNNFWKREGIIVAAAMAVTLVTWFVFPVGFIFFGILHAIALFSLLGLPFLRWPWFISVAAGIGALLVGLSITNPVFDNPLLWWVGLSTSPPVSNDYVPLFPWFVATLFGIGVAKFGDSFQWRSKLYAVSLPNLLEKPLAFIGRHSLVYYLLHQPTLFALVWLFTATAGPPDKTAGFIHSCSISCATQRSEAFCRAYCKCVAGNLKKEKLFTPYNNGEVDVSTNQKARTIINQCSSQTEG